MKTLSVFEHISVDRRAKNNWKFCHNHIVSVLFLTHTKRTLSCNTHLRPVVLNFQILCHPLLILYSNHKFFLKMIIKRKKLAKPVIQFRKTYKKNAQCYFFFEVKQTGIVRTFIKYPRYTPATEIVLQGSCKLIHGYQLLFAL